MGLIGALRFLAVAAAPELLLAMAPREAGPASVAVGSAGDIEASAHASSASLSSTGDKATLANAQSQQQYPSTSGTGASASPYSSGTGASPYSSAGGASPHSSGVGTSGGGISRGAGGVMGGASVSGTSSASTSSGKNCIVPMWDSAVNVCAAGSGKADTFKDSNKIKRTKASDGDLCTVKCPGTGTLSTYMIAPSVVTMTCKDGGWTDSKTQTAVAAIECATTTQAYIVSLIFFIVVAYCGNNWYNGKPLLEGTPFGQPPAPEHAPEVAVIVQTESTPAPEANANAH